MSTTAKKTKSSSRKGTKRKVTNKRGGKPPEEEVQKMTALGYVTPAAAAKAVGRAASSIYERVARDRLPQVDPERKPWVKTASGNLWIYLESVKKFSDPVALATAAPEEKK